jgi:lysozyme
MEDETKRRKMRGAVYLTLLDHLKGHEGFCSKAYQDHLGHWTIGFGRRIDGDKGLTVEESTILLENDVDEAKKQLEAHVDLPEDIDEVRHAILVAMVFQLGIGTFLKFKKMILAIEVSNWDKAAEEALDSRWAKQTPRRAKEVSLILKTGNWNA